MASTSDDSEAEKTTVGSKRRRPRSPQRSTTATPHRSVTTAKTMTLAEGFTVGRFGTAVLGTLVGDTTGTPAEFKKGKYGGVVPTQELVVELRRARTQRTKAGLAQGVRDADESAMAGVGGSLEVSCCGVSVMDTPCGHSRVVQHIFGNPAHLATHARKLAADSSGDAHMSAGVMLGLESIEDAGWEAVPRPKALSTLHDEHSRQHFTIASEIFGISYVTRVGEDSERAQVTFHKDDIPGTAAEVRQRLKLLKEMDHVNLARLLYAYEDDAEVHLIYEAQDGAGYLPMRVLSRQETLNAGEAAKLCQQLAAAAAACHRQNMQMLDWSPWNVMSTSYDSLFPMKVWGFGLAGVLHSGNGKGVSKAIWVHRGAYHYYAPELCRIRLDPDVARPLKKLDQSLRSPADIWGIGCLVYMSIAGHPPFGGTNETNVMRNVLASHLDLSAGFEAIERAGVELVERMLSHDPKGRPPVDKIIADAWVVGHVRAAEDKDQVGQIIDNICEFANLKPAMRALGRVLVQSMRMDKQRALEGVFHALDIKGDGELEPHELAAHFVHRTQELRRVFQVLDLNKSSNISMAEFVLANVFGKEILTERMLMRAFVYLDLDGTGEITASELYSALKAYEPSLTPTDVGDFMGEGDRDWDANIDFDEFRTFFPNVGSASRDIDLRIERAGSFLELFEQTFQKLKEDIVQWKCDLAAEMDKATKIRRAIERDEKGNHHDQWSKEVIAILKKGLQQLRNPPTPVPPLCAETNRLTTEEEERKRLAAKLRKQRPLDPEDPYEQYPGGPLGIDSFFKIHRLAWTTFFGKLTATAKEAATMNSKYRKRQDCITVLEDAAHYVRSVVERCEAFVEEQDSFLDAASLEPRIPRALSSRRGIVVLDSTSHKQAEKEIRRFVEDNFEKAERKKQQDAEREARQAALIRTEYGGERRGFAWLERQAAKAEQRGLPPPRGAVLMRESANRLNAKGALDGALAAARGRITGPGGPSATMGDPAAAPEEGGAAAEGGSSGSDQEAEEAA